jgi:NAD(P)H-quinone oxidoreductase subunit 5
LIGVLAISGIPPLAGFWSKDEILGSTFSASPLLWGIGWLTAGITAFYMFRMYFMTFEGQFRGNEASQRETIRIEQLQAMGLSMGPGAMNSQELVVEAAHKGDAGHDSHGHHGLPHESPFSMVLPLVVLAIPSIFIGLVGTPFANYFEAFVHPPGEAATVAELAEHFDRGEFFTMAGSSVAISLVGIFLAYMMYSKAAINPAAIAAKIPALYQLSKNKWYFDDVYNAVFVQGSRRLARQVLEVDSKVVDGVVNLTGLVPLVTGEALKYFENGRAQFYALIVFAAVLGLVIVSGIT